VNNRSFGTDGEPSISTIIRADEASGKSVSSNEEEQKKGILSRFWQSLCDFLCVAAEEAEVYPNPFFPVFTGRRRS